MQKLAPLPNLEVLQAYERAAYLMKDGTISKNNFWGALGRGLLQVAAKVVPDIIGTLSTKRKKPKQKMELTRSRPLRSRSRSVSVSRAASAPRNNSVPFATRSRARSAPRAQNKDQTIKLLEGYMAKMEAKMAEMELELAKKTTPSRSRSRSSSARPRRRNK